MKIKATHGVVFIVAHVKNGGVVDMMRYDSCVPANEVESGKLESAIHTYKPEWVVFRRFVLPGGTTTPTSARWASFGTTCPPRTFNDMYEAQRAIEGYKIGGVS